MDDTRTAAGLYESMKTDREPFLRAAEDAAKLTIPALLPPEGTTYNSIEQPYQGLGARAVSNLTAKLLLVLFPPQGSFFRLEPEEFSKETIAAISAAIGGEADPDKAATQVADSLNRIVKAVQQEIETGGYRVVFAEAIRHMVVAGNALLFLGDKGDKRLFPLSNFVVARDPEDHLQQIITEEEIAPLSLPESVAALLMREKPEEWKALVESDATKKTVKLHNWLRRSKDRSGWFDWSQTVHGIEIEKSKTQYKEDNLPYLPLGPIKVSGESYRRGLVEEQMGDLKSLNGLWRDITHSAAAMARLVYGVTPNSGIDVKALNETRNGGFFIGDADLVKAVQAGKFADLRFVMQAVDRLETRLERSFLLTESLQRNAERVTAEEIRIMAQELETAIGGVYTLMSQDFQLPLVRRLMGTLTKQKKIIPIPRELKKHIKPMIVTGIEALGSAHDLNQLGRWAEVTATLIGPERFAALLNDIPLAQKTAALTNTDTGAILKTEEQLQQERQQQQMQQAAQVALEKGTGPAINAASSAAQAQAQPA